jgi:hypothetical protein
VAPQSRVFFPRWRHADNQKNLEDAHISNDSYLIKSHQQKIRKKEKTYK